ncbi:MAG: Spore germination protein YndE [Candidatus Dichloromethanomonas elyunquensis]|nr:MAG: Spore germination protein YndE [Candidatus Dichloromethanomonas elyunquensis]
MQPEKITNTQAILLILGLRFTFFFLTISVNAPPADQDIWIAQLVSILYIFVLFLPFLYLSSKFPNYTLWEYFEQITGKFIGKFFILLYLGFILFLSVLIAVNLTLFIASSTIPETPAYVNLIFLLIPAVFAAYHGIVNAAKTAQIVIPVVLGFFLLTLALGIQNFHLKELLPVLKDSTLLQIHQGSLTFALNFHDAIFLFLMTPNMKEKKVKKAFFLSVVLSTLFFAAISIVPILVFGTELAKHSNYPFYLYVRQITVFDFIERMEALILAAWIMAALFKFSVYFYWAAKGFQQVFQTKSHRKFIIPFALSVFVIALSPKIFAIDMANKLSSIQVFPKISFVFIFAIPFLLLTIYFIRRLISSARNF